MDLSTFTPEQIAQLKGQLAGTDDLGRSPLRPRQLHDLRLLPTATDPRPLFIPSAEGTRDLPSGPLKVFPMLAWSPTGEEITLQDARERDQRVAEGYVLTPPVMTPVDPLTAVQSAFDALTPEEQAILVEEQRQDRLTALRAKVAGLSEAQLEALLAGQPEAKRGPGRPKKAQVA